MGAYWQKELPEGVGEVEEGQHLIAGHGCGRSGFPVKPAEWDHVCACRFGEARLSRSEIEWDAAHGTRSGGWSGDSHRYDIYRSRRNPESYAMRWWHGGGEGWLLDKRPLSGSMSILAVIAGLASEPVRWDCCHALAESIDRTATETARDVRGMMFAAFCEKRLKKRKRGNKYIMEIVPKAPPVAGNVAIVA